MHQRFSAVFGLSSRLGVKVRRQNRLRMLSLQVMSHKRLSLVTAFAMDEQDVHRFSPFRLFSLSISGGLYSDPRG